MKILIAGLVKGNQLKRLIEEGKKRGHTIDGCYSSDLIIMASSDGFAPSIKNKSIKDYDLIYIWAVGQRRWEWYTTANYLHKKHGTKIINKKIIDPSYQYFLTPTSDYAKQVEAGLPFPKSATILSPNSIDTIVSEFEFPLILKASPSKQGRGVFKIESKEKLITKIKELKSQGHKAFIIREFIPNRGDIRVFTVGYKAIGAMTRTAAKGDFRSNISRGGTGSSFDIKNAPKIRKLAEKMSEITRTEIAGVDIMLHKGTAEPYILEINPGPQFTGLEKYTATNAAEEIIKYFESL